MRPLKEADSVSPATCSIAVMVRSVEARSMKVFGGHINYGSNQQAAAIGELYVLPRSQVTKITDLGHGKHIIELPRWLAKKERLLKHCCA